MTTSTIEHDANVRENATALARQTYADSLAALTDKALREALDIGDIARSLALLSYALSDSVYRLEQEPDAETPHAAEIRAAAREEARGYWQTVLGAWRVVHSLRRSVEQREGVPA